MLDLGCLEASPSHSFLPHVYVYVYVDVYIYVYIPIKPCKHDRRIGGRGGTGSKSEIKKRKSKIRGQKSEIKK